jgi:hypothetical protein
MLLSLRMHTQSCGSLRLPKTPYGTHPPRVGRQAFKSWSELTVKARAAIMFRFHHLLETHAEELADIVSLA